MEDGGTSRPNARHLPFVALAVVALLGAWVFFRSYRHQSTDECGKRYKSARNAEDTARVDQIVLSKGSLNSCGTMRGFMTTSSDSSIVHGIARGITDADNRRDLITVLNYYADSAVLVPPGEAPVAGIAGIQKRYEALFENWVPAIEPRVEEIVVNGATATVRGHNGGWLRTLAAGGADRALDDNYTMTLERRGGTWLIYRLQWTRNTR